MLVMRMLLASQMLNAPLGQSSAISLIRDCSHTYWNLQYMLSFQNDIIQRLKLECFTFLRHLHLTSSITAKTNIIDVGKDHAADIATSTPVDQIMKYGFPSQYQRCFGLLLNYRFTIYSFTSYFYHTMYYNSLIDRNLTAKLSRAIVGVNYIL